MNKLLSIIIPTYNMERYLRKCLDSLLVETALMDQLEVLVINDGSKDSSSAIAHEYEAKYPQTFRVVDKANGHYGSCVNKGLELATGKYVKVLDADDSFDNKAFSIFLQKIADIDVDLILTDMETIYVKDNKHLKSRFKSIDPNQTLPFAEVIANNPLFFYGMWHITYKLSILKSMKYVQLEGCLYTDTQWSCIPSSKVRLLYYIPLSLYKYLVGREGQSVSAEIYHNSISDSMKVCLSKAAFLEKETIDKSIIPFIENAISVDLSFIYCYILFEYTKRMDLLCEFDLVLEQYRKAYDISKRIKGFRNFYCVQYWRKHNRKPLPIYFAWIRHLGMLKYKLKR